MMFFKYVNTWKISRSFSNWWKKIKADELFQTLWSFFIFMIFFKIHELFSNFLTFYWTHELFQVGEIFSSCQLFLKPTNSFWLHQLFTNPQFFFQIPRFYWTCEPFRVCQLFFKLQTFLNPVNLFWARELFKVHELKPLFWTRGFLSNLWTLVFEFLFSYISHFLEKSTVNWWTDQTPSSN